MASESTDGDRVSSEADLDTWLEARADALGLDRDAFVERLLAAYRTAVTDADVAVDAAPSARLDEIEREHQAHLEDVRKRVLQVKATAEERAPMDHHHEAFDRLDELDEQVSVLADEVESLAATTEELDDRDVATEAALAEVEEKLTRVARAVVQLREDDADETLPAPVDDAKSERLADLHRIAAREGYERATCGACGETVHVGLLPEAACPACGAPFASFEPGGLLRKPTLRGPGEGGG